MNKSYSTSLGVTLALIAGAAGQASAQEQITLKFASGQSPASIYEAQGSQVFMNRVVELTGGKVKFEYYPAGQLAKPDQMISIVESGIADIAQVASAYESERLALTSMLELPGLFDLPCAGTIAYNKMMDANGVAKQHEYDGKKYRFLYAVANPQSEISTASKEIRMPADVAGLKIRVAGAGSGLVVEALGGVAVRLSGPDTYQSYQRGTVDGVMFTWNALKQFDVHTLSKHTTSGLGFGSTALIWVMSNATWDRLSADVQQAIEQAANENETHLCESMEAELAQARGVIEGVGVKVTEFSPEVVAEFKAAISPVVDQWISRIEGRNLPAKQAIAEFEAQLPGN